MASKFKKSFWYEGMKYQIYGKTLSEVEEKVFLKKLALRAGNKPISHNLSVEAWGKKAVELYKTNQADITRERYISVMRSSIFRHIGDIKLKNATPIILQECLNRCEGMSKEHISKVYQQIRFIFSSAYKNRLIDEDPSKNLIKPKGTVSKRRSLTSEERRLFLEVANSDPIYLPFLFMLYCGCRPTEARKLTHDDITNIEGKTLLHIRGTKTSNADRYVPIPNPLLQMINKLPKIEKYCVIKKHIYTKRFEKLRDGMRLLMGGDGKWIEVKPTGKKPYWKKEWNVDPLAKDFVPYCLRHTFCTDLRDKGVDIRDAQYLMGHANISITANIYTHSDLSTAMRVANIL